MDGGVGVVAHVQFLLVVAAGVVHGRVGALLHHHLVRHAVDHVEVETLTLLELGGRTAPRHVTAAAVAHRQVSEGAQLLAERRRHVAERTHGSEEEERRRGGADEGEDVHSFGGESRRRHRPLLGRRMMRTREDGAGGGEVR